MGMPIVCTRLALSGTKGKAPVQVCRSPAEWAESLANLWESRTARQELGASARMWVSEHHTWEAVAQTAEQGIRQTMERQKADGSNDRLVEVKMRQKTLKMP